jgi:hypothetical protein
MMIKNRLWAMLAMLLLTCSVSAASADWEQFVQLLRKDALADGISANV